MTNRKKIISVLLICLLTVVCFANLSACKDRDGGNTDKEYTITWKNYNGEVLKVDERVKEGAMPSYNGATPTQSGDEFSSYTFAGWEPAITAAAANVTYTAKFTEQYIGAKDPAYNPALLGDGKTIQYGLYPQTHVNDAAIIAELNELTATQTNGWYLLNGEYYARQTASVYNGESYSFDDGTEIVNGTAYWFKCEPITWQVLSATGGTYYALSAKLLCAHNFYNDYASRAIGGNTVYANNYERSSMRSWLNGEFFKTAFALNGAYVQRVSVSNGAATTDVSNNKYVCADTTDRVYLPSYRDYINADYGFDTDAADTSATRACVTTDYARATGAWCNTAAKLQYNGSYWTRSASNEFYYCAWNVNSGGFLSEYAVDGVHGVRPCISVRLASAA